ncbi:UNVERIFIED_CONTAM: microtubule-associated protein 5 [Sesamum calycinum]|uniref:Microtubule-associated protein 5 n=1 Tax=Sesamum calycinum TaxID=2727403 RepID=A0AAW2SYE0_9LAMI
MSIGSSNSSPLSLSKSATTTCASLLRELQVGGNRKYGMKLEKVTLRGIRYFFSWSRSLGRRRSRKYIAELHQSLAASEAEIAQLSSALGERVSVPRYDKMRDELDLTTKKLGELKSHLQELEFEKNLRLQKVSSHISAIHELTVVMSLDFKKIMAEIHPSFVDTAAGQSKSISNETLARLTSELNLVKQKKQQRLLRLISDEEAGISDRMRVMLPSLFFLHKILAELLKNSGSSWICLLRSKQFYHVTSLITSTADEVSSPGSLSNDVIEQSRSLYRCFSIFFDCQSQRTGSKQKGYLDKVEKWRHAAEEESWLDEYERDENRYSAGRGVHKNLKRAEKARILVSKIPSLVESLTLKVKAWELEKGTPFLYNKEQKKLQDQLATEQETLFGSKPNVKKPLGQSTYANTMVATPNSRRVGIPSARHGISSGKDRRDSGKAGGVIPINYVALSKDDRGS